VRSNERFGDFDVFSWHGSGAPVLIIRFSIGRMFRVREESLSLRGLVIGSVIMGIECFE
jgi:hypothetical protein